MNKGLVLKESLKSPKLKGSIVSYDRKTSKDIHNEDFLDKFISLKNRYHIKEEFDDNKWSLYLETKKVVIDFPFEFNKKFNTALKIISTHRLEDKLEDAYSVKTVIATTNRCATLTGMFSIENYELLEEYLLDIKPISRKGVIGSLLSVLHFYNTKASEYYIQKLSQFKIKNTIANRALPNYKSILLFDYILKDFTDNCSVEDRIKYLPLLLWWNITRVIPLRPIEFVSLSQQCTDFSNGHYTISVPRLKESQLENKSSGNIRTDVLPITKDIYDLIQEYKSLANYTQNKYLLSYNLYHSQTSKNSQASAALLKYNKDVFCTNQLYALIQRFYDDIIEKQYCVVSKLVSRTDDLNTIQRIRPGDTRHLAFCSMMLQGLNPLTIAKIGGHKSLKTQQGYYSHLETFVDANVSTLAKQIRNVLSNNLDNMNVYNNVFNTRESLIRKMQSEKSFDSTKARRIEGGFCLSKNFPYECPPNTDCILCSKHIADMNDTDLMTRKASVGLKKTHAETKKQVDFLIDLFKKYDKSNNIETLIRNTSETIKRTISQESIYLAYDMKNKEVIINE
ncbi:hypothetical protein ACV3UL_15585 [Clostridium perfringens]